MLGYNSRLDEVQACFLNQKLKILDKINSHKRNLAEIYFKNIEGNYILPSRSNHCFDVYHIFNIRTPKRDKLKHYLHSKGIGTEIHYPVPPHQQNASKPLINGNFPISEEIHETTLSLPIAYFHSEKDIFRVCEELRIFSKNFL